MWYLVLIGRFMASRPLLKPVSGHMRNGATGRMADACRGVDDGEAVRNVERRRR